MAKMMVQLLGFILGLLGLVGTVVATVLPQWRRQAYIGGNIITATGTMMGLWMDCVWRSTGIYECQFHRSLLAMPLYLQAARALMVISCVLSVLALVVASVGMKCTRFAEQYRNKSTLAVCGGCGLLLAGLLCLITVSWTTNDVVRQFYSPILPSGQKYEIGTAVYLGFISAVLSIAGGAVLCLYCDDSKMRFPHVSRAITVTQKRPPQYHRSPASATITQQLPPQYHRSPASPTIIQQPPLQYHRSPASPTITRQQPPQYHHSLVSKSSHRPSRFSASVDGYKVGDFV